MIFTGYWKVLVLTFSEMGNTVFSRAKKLTEISYFELFGDWKYGLFLSQEVDGKMIFTGYWEVLVLNFSMMGNTVFFQPKSWWEDDIYVVFLSFVWYSRTWELWFFAQWKKCHKMIRNQVVSLPKSIKMVEHMLLFWRKYSKKTIISSKFITSLLNL